MYHLRSQFLHSTIVYSLEVEHCKVLRSVAFILAAIFLALVRENATKDRRKSHKSPFVIDLNIRLCSLDVNIGVVRTLENEPYRLQRVQFVAF